MDDPDGTEHVESRADFVRYAAALADQIEAGEWGRLQRSPEELLRASSRWVADMDGYFRNRDEDVPATPSWRLFAQIITAALTYD